MNSSPNTSGSLNRLDDGRRLYRFTQPSNRAKRVPPSHCSPPMLPCHARATGVLRSAVSQKSKMRTGACSLRSAGVHWVVPPPAMVNARLGFANHLSDRRGDSPDHPVPVTVSPRTPARATTRRLRTV